MRYFGMSDNKALLIIAFLVFTAGGLYRATAPRLNDEIRTTHGTVKFDRSGKIFVFP
jgi:hypothetical protein